jgi:hypothetical protein
VLLRVAAPVQVQHDAARAVGDPSVIGEREPEVRLADSSGAVHDGERAGQQAAVEHRIELGNAGLQSVEGGAILRELLLKFFQF